MSNTKTCPIIIIAAMGLNRVIGNKGTIPWKCKEDMKHFREKTLNNTVIMGRKTFESMGSKALPSRTNIVISKTLCESKYSDPNVTIFPSLRIALHFAQKLNKPIFLIGGSQIYEEGAKYTSKVYLTLIPEKPTGDTFFPKNLLDDFKIENINTLVNDIACTTYYRDPPQIKTIKCPHCGGVFNHKE